MRRRLPYDAAICVGLALLIAWAVVTLPGKMMESAKESKKEELAPVSGEVGGVAGEEVFRAQTLEDMLSHDTFTVECPYRDFFDTGIGFYKDKPFHGLTLPSGERVAVIYNEDNIQYVKSDVILPVGRIVYDDLTSDETFLSNVEHGGALTRKDLYVDMAGTAEMMSKQDFLPKDSTGTKLIQLIIIIVLYPIFHALGSKFGLWNPYFRKRNKSEWE